MDCEPKRLSDNKSDTWYCQDQNIGQASELFYKLNKVHKLLETLTMTHYGIKLKLHAHSEDKQGSNIISWDYPNQGKLMNIHSRPIIISIINFVSYVYSWNGYPTQLEGSGLMKSS